MINSRGYWSEAEAQNPSQGYSEARLTDGKEETIVRLTIARKNPKLGAGHPLDTAKWARLLADFYEKLYQDNAVVFDGVEVL